MEQANTHTINLHDTQSYEQLFKAHYSNLCSYANKYLEDLDAAEETVQDVFVKLWENKDRLEITSNIQSYLFRAVRNACLNLIKHISVREEYKEHNARELESSQVLVDDDFFASELEERIREAIDLLPPERRKIFIMSRYDGLKYREIAEKLNIADKTVENQMGRAISFLREKLSKYLIITVLYILKMMNGNG